MSTFSSANITDGSLVLKECTHRIKIKHSMHQYAICLHNLGNWLIVCMKSSMIILGFAGDVLIFRWKICQSRMR